MIFLKKSLTTIIILVIAIWVMPAISDNDGTNLCQDILKNVCNFAISDDAKDLERTIQTKFKAIEQNKELFINRYFRDKDNQKFLTSETIKYINEINKIKNMKLFEEDKLLWTRIRNKTNKSKINESEITKSEKKLLEEEFRNKIIDLRVKLFEEVNELEMKLMGKKLTEEIKTLEANILRSFQKSSSELQKQIDEKKVALMTLNFLIADDFKGVLNNLGDYIETFTQDKIGKLTKLQHYIGKIRKIVEVSNLITELNENIITEKIARYNSGTELNEIELNEIEIKKFELNEIDKIMNEIYKNKLNEIVITELNEIEIKRIGKIASEFSDREIRKIVIKEIKRIGKIASEFSSREFYEIDFKGVFTANNYAVVLLKNFALEYMTYLQTIKSTENITMQTFCKEIYANNIIEFWNKFYFSNKFSHLDLKDTDIIKSKLQPKK